MSLNDSSPCVFCLVSPKAVLVENELAFAVRDSNPVTPLHTLILPRRHVSSFFDLTEAEALSIERLVRKLHDEMIAMDVLIEGFNIGINVGRVAGQTISHCHYHLIPRRRGDVPNPRGGVRWVIPSKGNY
jgi:ATP adenylyltransferase